MAKKRDDGNAKVRVLVFEMEGSNETIQESLQTLAGAFNRNNPPARPSLPRQQAAPALEQAVDDAEYVEAEEAEAPAKRSPSNNRNRTYRKPEVLDLELDAEVSLRSFCNAKNTNSHAKKYLTVMAWFHEHRDTPIVNADHLYTAYKKMNWHGIPRDVNQTFRTLKSQGLVSSKEGGFEINHIGLGKVAESSSGDQS